MTPEELEDDELIIDDRLTPIERMTMFVKSSVILHRYESFSDSERHDDSV